MSGENVESAPESKEEKKERRIFKDDAEEYIYKLRKGNSNILVTSFAYLTQVAVRCRPLTPRELEGGPITVVKILSRQLVLVQDLGHRGPEEAFRGFRPRGKPYAFDYAFDEDASQVRKSTWVGGGVQEDHEVLDRGTSRRFPCYGVLLRCYRSRKDLHVDRDGMGRMLGTSENPGIMFRALKDMVDLVQRPSSYETILRMWYVEVYNEILKDLLSPARVQKIEIREDPIKGSMLVGAKEVLVTSTEDIMDLLKFGNRNRTKESTWVNETSSRSHAVLQILIERRDRIQLVDTEAIFAKLTLIDLAGSERAIVTKNRGIRLVEEGSINRSLLALANCINALAMRQVRSVKDSHIPYRDSKLTRLLKDTLGGKCRTIMIANISPSILCYEDTLNTLKYANRAKQIKTQVTRNMVNARTHIRNYEEAIGNLKQEVTALRKQLEESKAKRIDTLLHEANQHETPETVKLYYPSEKVRKIDFKLRVYFDREMKIKRKILELEQDTQHLSSDFFNTQLKLTQCKKERGENNADCAQLNRALETLRQKIENNGYKMKAHLQSLQEMEDTREQLLDEIKQQMLNCSLDHEAFKFLLRNHMHESLQVDYQRNNLYALFLLRQRENYIDHLKEEVSKSRNPRESGENARAEEANLLTMLKMEQDLKTTQSCASLPEINRRKNSVSEIMDTYKTNLLFLKERTEEFFPSPLVTKTNGKYLPLIRKNGKSKFYVQSIFPSADSVETRGYASSGAGEEDLLGTRTLVHKKKKTYPRRIHLVRKRLPQRELLCPIRKPEGEDQFRRFQATRTADDSEDN